MHIEPAASDRKPEAGPTFRPVRHTRKNVLAQIREEVTVLHTLGFDHEAIAREVRITPDDARLLCPTFREKASRRNLSRRALNALLHGRHAEIGGRTLAKRAKHLVEIAMAYSADELAAEPGIGTVTTMEIRQWLEGRGLSLRGETQVSITPSL